MRAGLAPALTRAGGSLDGIGPWRRALMQPALGQGSLCERLAQILLLAPDIEDVEFGRLHPDWPLPGLPEIARTPRQNYGTCWDLDSFVRCLANEEERSSAVQAVDETLARLHRHLLLQIDQLEEVFTTPEIATEERTAFFGVLGDLLQSGRVWCLATLRSEYFPLIAKEPLLRALIGGDGGYILAPPDRQSLREIILYPALAARLDYQHRVEEKTVAGEPAQFELLEDQILADAEISPDPKKYVWRASGLKILEKIRRAREALALTEVIST
jgi:hypothetical protein